MPTREETQLRVNAAWTDAAQLFAGEVLIESLRRYLEDFTGQAA
jgi:hypothetical protein